MNIDDCNDNITNIIDTNTMRYEFSKCSSFGDVNLQQITYKLIKQPYMENVWTLWFNVIVTQFVESRGAIQRLFVCDKKGNT